MRPITVAEAMSEFAAAMVGEHDIAGTLSDILANCAEIIGADACGLLVNDGDHGLQLLGATSHRAEDLELYQAQISEGPCVETCLNGITAFAAGADVVSARWPYFGPRMVDAGFLSVIAVPMTWHERPFGALNLFSSSDAEPTDENLAVVQTFADLATILVIHVDELSVQETAARIRAALESRTLIEQAKGVLSHREGIDMAAAYNRILVMSSKQSSTLTSTAAEVIAEAQQR